MIFRFIVNLSLSGIFLINAAAYATGVQLPSKLILNAVEYASGNQSDQYMVTGYLDCYCYLPLSPAAMQCTMSIFVQYKSVRLTPDKELFDALITNFPATDIKTIYGIKGDFIAKKDLTGESVTFSGELDGY